MGIKSYALRLCERGSHFDLLSILIFLFYILKVPILSGSSPLLLIYFNTFIFLQFKHDRAHEEVFVRHFERFKPCLFITDLLHLKIIKKKQSLVLPLVLKEKILLFLCPIVFY